MPKPHTCPTCQGYKEITAPTRESEKLELIACPTCDATGVVWETTLQDVSAVSIKQGIETGGTGSSVNASGKTKGT
jgi:hypothetical protein